MPWIRSLKLFSGFSSTRSPRSCFHDNTACHLPHLHHRIAASGANFDDISRMKRALSPKLRVHCKMANSRRVSLLSSINWKICLAWWRSQNLFNQRDLHWNRRAKVRISVVMNHRLHFCRASTIFSVLAWGSLGSSNFPIVSPMSWNPLCPIDKVRQTLYSRSSVFLDNSMGCLYPQLCRSWNLGT